MTDFIFYLPLMELSEVIRNQAFPTLACDKEVVPFVEGLQQKRSNFLEICVKPYFLRSFQDHHSHLRWGFQGSDVHPDDGYFHGLCVEVGSLAGPQQPLMYLLKDNKTDVSVK